MSKTILLTGIPCSGKTTLAYRVKEKISNSTNCVILDGDLTRGCLCSGLGFSPEGIRENLRRVACISKILNDQGLDVICATVSPRKEFRDMMRDIIGENSRLVYVECSKEKCIERDVKGMWQKAIDGEMKGFIGYDAPYEVPEELEADLILNTENLSIEECVDKVVELMVELV